MPRVVDVTVRVRVTVPTSRKRDKTLAAMAMEASASEEVRLALDLSQFVTRVAGGVEVQAWDITDAVLKESGA